MKKTKVLSFVLVLAMLMSLLPMSAFAAETAYQDGTYTKTAEVTPDEWEDFEAYTISVDVKVEGGKVASVAFSEGNTFGDEENETYCTRAMNGRGSKAGVAAQIVANNGVEGVDTVSTATCTSNAIIAAADAALSEAEAAVPASGYVLMNIPYDEFYAAEGVEGVDAVTSATVKTYNQTMAGGSYHEGYAAADPISDAVILGVTYPVYVEDLSVLSGLTEVKAEDTATITVASGKSSTVEKEVSGVDLLFASGTYAYYVLDEAPNAYKTLSVDGENFSFSATTAVPTAAQGMEVEVAYGGHYTDIDFAVAADEVTDTCVVNGITLTTSDGEEYALRHVEDIWRKTSLGWNWDSLDGNGLSGKTITKVTYYIVDNGSYAVYEYAVNETIKRNPGTVTAAFEDADTVVLTGLPEDMQNPAATVKSVVGRGETAVVIAENVSVVDGKVAVTDPVDGTSYSVTVTSDNYGDVSAEADYHVCAAAAFSDVKLDAWYHDAIDFVLKAGYMNGNPNSTFAPDEALSRGMLVQILYNMEGRPAYTAKANFADVSEDQWFYDAVMWAAENGIVTGYNEKTFGPDDKVTREQMVTILRRYQGEPEAENGELTFSDAADVDDWAKAAVAWAVENGVVKGVGNNLFNPNGNSKRADAAQVFMNYFAK